jgi:hypothetical protein
MAHVSIRRHAHLKNLHILTPITSEHEGHIHIHVFIEKKNNSLHLKLIINFYTVLLRVVYQ